MKLLSKKSDEEQIVTPTRKKRRLKKARKFIVIGIVVVLVAGIVIKYFVIDNTNTEVDSTYQYVTVERTDISQTLSSTGTLEPIETYSVDTLISGEIIEAPFEEGDIVNEGDLLYKVDTAEIERSIEKQQLNIEKAQMNLDDLLEANKNLNVTSNTNGVVSKVYIEEGDKVNSGQSIADVVDNSSMLLKVPFNSSDMDQIRVGQEAVVTMDNSFETLSGTVTDINQAEEVRNGYMLVKYVTIKVKNPGGISTSSNATATIGDIACNNSATFESLSGKTITAATSGEVFDLFIKEGDLIEKGDLVVLLEGSDSSTTIKFAEMTLTDAKLTLDDLYDQMDDYNITSPISGTVITKEYNVGETVSSSNAMKTMATIYDLTKLTFDLSVDELDIGLIEVGQTVSVTCEAIQNTVFEGYVSNVSLKSTTSNGVTTYPATVIIEEPGDLLPGMNISAEIVVDSRENVLVIPVSAVSRGNTVYVKSDSESAVNSIQSGGMPQRPSQNTDIGEKTDTEVPSSSAVPVMPANIGARMSAIDNAPEGYTRVRVELGLNNDDYIEVTSGLVEGDEIAYEEVATESAETVTFDMGGMGAISGMPSSGGGMQGGSAPGGGMPGGNR